MKSKCNLVVIRLLVFFLFVFVLASKTIAEPVGPSVTTVTNTTKASSAGQMINNSGNYTNNQTDAGGWIFTVNLEANTQNARWKAYVGNVSGNLVLDDAEGNSIYSWSTGTTVTGQVYATRTSGVISWASINCSPLVNVSNEEVALNHTSSTDNLTSTFSVLNNSEFFVGNVKINEKTCYTIHTYVNDAAQNDYFEESLLHDGSNLVYSTIMEQNQNGYDNNEKYDFQMILPEMGYSGWSSSTPYYFYVELG